MDGNIIKQCLVEGTEGAIINDMNTINNKKYNNNFTSKAP
jgi:hypothetical protein